MLVLVYAPVYAREVQVHVEDRGHAKCFSSLSRPYF